jgi:hypothetical protein
MPKAIHNYKVSQGESMILNRGAGFQLHCSKETGKVEALQDFLDGLEKWFLLNGVSEAAKPLTMSNAVPDKTLSEVVVRCMNSILACKNQKKI